MLRLIMTLCVLMATLCPVAAQENADAVPEPLRQRILQRAGEYLRLFNLQVPDTTVTIRQLNRNSGDTLSLGYGYQCEWIGKKTYEDMVWMGFDDVSFRLVRMTDFRENKILDETKPAVTVTAEAAVQNLHALMRLLNMNPAEWLISDNEDIQDGEHRVRELYLHRLYNDIPSNEEKMMVDLHPTTGRVLHFSCWGMGRMTYLLPSRPPISEDRARAIALQAFREGAGFAPPSPPRLLLDRPHWRSAGLPDVCHLVYSYHFDVPQGERNVIYGAEIEAETGELKWFRGLTGGGGANNINPAKVKPSSRFALVARLLKQKEAQIWAKALSTGTPLAAPKTAPKSTHRVLVDGKPHAFALDAKKRGVYWSEGEQVWQGLKLSPQVFRLIEKEAAQKTTAKPKAQ